MPERFRSELLTTGPYTNPASFTFYFFTLSGTYIITKFEVDTAILLLSNFVRKFSLSP